VAHCIPDPSVEVHVWLLEMMRVVNTFIRWQEDHHPSTPNENRLLLRITENRRVYASGNSFACQSICVPSRHTRALRRDDRAYHQKIFICIIASIQTRSLKKIRRDYLYRAINRPTGGIAILIQQ